MSSAATVVRKTMQTSCLRLYVPTVYIELSAGTAAAPCPHNNIISATLHWGLDRD